ncbi:MAG TPA: hypothetical protein VM452_09270 [Caulifigura sp.]|nr:hypothetical protein [Caulifigura sp.]
MHLPREWSVVAEAATISAVALVRRFHRPTGLEEGTRVGLAVPAGWPVHEIRVNGVQLVDCLVGEKRVFDLSEIIRLREAHDLRVEFVRGAELKTQAYLVSMEIAEE